jgi:hypothetical protein
MGGKSGKIAARSGNEVATDGKVGGKNGKDAQGCGDIHVATPVVAMGCARMFLTLYEVVQVLAAPGGTMTIELKYHKERRLSREGARGQMGRRPWVKKVRSPSGRGSTRSQPGKPPQRKQMRR